MHFIIRWRPTAPKKANHAIVREAAAAGGAVASVEDCWAPWEAAVAVGAACCCCARGESGGLGARAESKMHDN